MPVLSEINYLAILAAALSSMVIGALWYSPVLFAKPWMVMIGKTEEDLKSGAKTGYLYAVICSLIAAFIMAQFVYLMGADSLKSGVKLGLWIWLGFTFTSALTHDVFEGRPLKLTLLNSGYFLVNYIVMGAILALWK